MSERLKCRFCNFSVLKYRKGADGKNISGFSTLLRHVDDEHEAEWEAIQEGLDASSRDVVDA